MTITATTSRFLGRVVRAAVLAAVEVPATVTTSAPAVPTVAAAPIPAPTMPASTGDLFAVLGAFADESDEMGQRFTAAATGTPVEAPKPAETVELAKVVRPAAPRVFATGIDMPTVAEIEEAGALFVEAAEKSRQGDRGTRKSRRVLDRLAAGTYGKVAVDWQTSNREVIDIDEVEKVFRALGRPVPYKQCADSIRITVVD